jgi:hypothetical protein
MPFALTAEQRNYRADIADRLRVARLKLAAANHEAAALAHDIASTAQLEIEAQPRRWRTTRAGRAAEAWAAQWRAFDATPTDTDAAERFNALPDSAAPE